MSVQTSTARDMLASAGLAYDEPEGIPTLTPKDTDELAELVERVAQLDLRLVPVGNGTKLSFARPELSKGSWPQSLVAVSTRHLDEVVAYEPGDGTLTAQAGCSWSQLTQTVAAGGHRLTPDVPRPAQATLGGVLGAGLSGPDRLRFGPLRHHVLGMRVVRAGGAIAKSGGRLVKNVTGFDLHRLHCGARGSLGVITEASLRLFPAPERELTLTLAGLAPRELFEQAERMRLALARPIALTIENCLEPDAAHWRLHARLEGRAATVSYEREQLLAELPAGVEIEQLEGEAARERAAATRDLVLRERSPGGERAWPALRLTCLPTQTAGNAYAPLEGFARAAGLELRVVAQPGVSEVEAHLDLDGLGQPEVAAQRIAELRDEVEAAEVRLETRAVPAALIQGCSDLLPEKARAWMRSLHAQLDPHDTFLEPSGV